MDTSFIVAVYHILVYVYVYNINFYWKWIHIVTSHSDVEFIILTINNYAPWILGKKKAYAK